MGGLGYCLSLRGIHKTHLRTDRHSCKIRNRISTCSAFQRKDIQTNIQITHSDAHSKHGVPGAGV